MRARLFRWATACGTVALMAVASGCDAGAGPVAEGGEGGSNGMTLAAAGWGGVTATVELVVAFDPAAGELPEGIAARTGGGIYVGMTGLGEIRRVADGTSEVVATIPLEEGDIGVLGLTFREDGTLYAAVVSSSDAIRGVWRIGRDGEAAHVAGTHVMAFPNDLAFDRRGNLYVTDSAAGSVWRISRDGSVDLWVQDDLLTGTGDFGLGIPIGANGIVFVPGRSGGGAAGQAGQVFVANTERGQLIRVPLMADGGAGQPVLVLAGEELVGLDGIVADEHGRIFGAVNVQDKVVVIAPDGSSVETVAAEGLDFPAGVVFGTTGADRHALFVTNFALANEVDPAPGVARLYLGPPGRR